MKNGRKERRFSPLFLYAVYFHTSLRLRRMKMEVDINNYIDDKQMSIPFCVPDISELEINEVVEVLKSGWITTGPKTKKLEGLLADYLDVPKVICLNSQTACGELSLRLMGIGAGSGGSAEDEVICASYTYTASASVIDHVGAKIVLVDCQKDSVEMDYDALEAAINEHTKAIIPVDIGGVPCDYKRIMEIVERKRPLFKPAGEMQEALGRVAVIDDAAHALGASVKLDGKKVMLGAAADITNFSFHAVKNFTTAEGGALAWNIKGIDNEAVYHKLQLLSLHGQSKDALSINRVGDWEYDIIGPWYKYNMTDIMAGIGIAQLSRYPKLLKKRRNLIGKYNEVLVPLGIGVLDHYNRRHTSSGHLFIARVPGISEEERNQIIYKMAQAGIACNVHFKPLPMLTAYKKMGFDIKDFPNAYNMYKNAITLPLYSKLTDLEANYVVNTFARIVKEYLK